MKTIVLSIFIILLIFSSCSNYVAKTDIETIDLQLYGKWYFGMIPTGYNLEFTPTFWYLNFPTQNSSSYYIRASNGNINKLDWDGKNEGLLGYYQFAKPSEFENEILEAIKSNDNWRLYNLYRLRAAAESGNLCRFIFNGSATLTYLIEDLYGNTYLLARWENVSPDLYIDE